MKTYVISVGGSAIVPDKINVNFLKQLKKTVNKLKKNNKLVLVTGGGITSRKYMSALNHMPENAQAWPGIVATKLNAALVGTYLGLKPGVDIDSIADIKNQLQTTNLVVCGALGYQPGMTSDGDAIQIAHGVQADGFINVTNVKGLYTKDPNKFKSAKFIPEISINNFSKILNKMSYKAGQHFILDQKGTKLAKKYGIKVIVCRGLENVENIILGKKFTGTVIE